MIPRKRDTNNQGMTKFKMTIKEELGLLTIDN